MSGLRFLLMIILVLPIFLPRDANALPANFVKTKIVSNLSEPTDFVFTPDGRIFITQANGTIRVFKNGQLLSTPLVKVSATNQGGDRGLLSITLDPDFENNKHVYIYYTNVSPLDNRITRLTVNGDKADLGSETILFKTTQPLQPNHHGGQLAFSPDGKLWLGIGENSNSQNSQDLSNVHGKLLRINKNGSIPSDNPFVGQSGKHPAIWAYGLRNPFRLTFNNGVPVIADVGGSVYEEVNIGVKGGNFGWPICEGNFRGNTNDTCPDKYVKPVYTYPHSGGASITGGFFYTGNNFPQEYKGSYFYGDYVQGFIKRLIINSQNQVIKSDDFDLNAGTPVSLKGAPDGSLYFLNVFPGELYQIKYSTNNQSPIAKISANPQFGKKPLKVNFSSEGSTDPEGKPLKYMWDFGDGSSSTEQNPTHIYKNKGLYTAKLTVNDGELNSEIVSIQIGADNLPPEIEFTSPSENRKYNAGDKISFSAKAKDPDGGKLKTSFFSWEVIFHHADHIHPFLGPITNTTSSEFTIPNTGEVEANVWYEIKLTVTDKSGLKATASRNIFPNKAKLTIDTDPKGLEVKYNGTSYISLITLESVVGFKHNLEVVSPQSLDGSTYIFDSWSDGGGKSHSIITPSINTTYTAKLKKQGSGESRTFSLNPGEKRNINVNSVISGDVKINGQVLYDNDGKTGLVVLMEQAGEVEAPWGATVYENPDRAVAENKMDQVAEEMTQKGCGSSCKNVIKYFWPSGNIRNTRPLQESSSQGQSSPSPSPSLTPSPAQTTSPTPVPSVTVSPTPQASPSLTPSPSPSSSPISEPVNLPSPLPSASPAKTEDEI